MLPLITDADMAAWDTLKISSANVMNMAAWDKNIMPWWQKAADGWIVTYPHRRPMLVFPISNDLFFADMPLPRNWEPCFG